MDRLSLRHLRRRGEVAEAAMEAGASAEVIEELEVKEDAGEVREGIGAAGGGGHRGGRWPGETPFCH